PLVLDRRGGSLAHRTALARSLGRCRDRRWHVVAQAADAGPHSLSIRDAAHLGEHPGMGAERFQPPARRSRRRPRYASLLAASAPAGHAVARSVGIVNKDTGAVGDRGLPIRRRAGQSASPGYTRDLPDLARYRPWHQPAVARTPRRISKRIR